MGLYVQPIGKIVMDIFLPFFICILLSISRHSQTAKARLYRVSDGGLFTVNYGAYMDFEEVLGLGRVARLYDWC